MDLLAFMDDAETLNPTPFPSPLPWTKARREMSMIVGFTISMVDRVAIGSLCAYRMWRYYQAGLLRWDELKVKFHCLLLLTVPMYTPYYGLCLDHYGTWQCYMDKSRVSVGLYRTTWILYSLYRIGLSLQLMCLSITVLQWCVSPGLLCPPLLRARGRAALHDNACSVGFEWR